MTLKMTRALPLAATFITASLVMAPQSHAQAEPDLFAVITALQDQVRAQTNSDPSYTFFDPKNVATSIAASCTTGGYGDDLRYFRVRPSGTKLSAKVTEFDGIGEGSVATRTFVGIDNVNTKCGFNCNYTNTDTVTARIMKRGTQRNENGKPQFTAWRKYGPLVTLVPDRQHLNVQAVGAQSPITSLRGQLEPKGRLKARKLRAKLYGVEIRDTSTSVYLPGAQTKDKRVLVLRKRKQTIPITR